MRKFTIVLILSALSLMGLKAQNITLPYQQDFSSLTNGNMTSSAGTATAVTTLPTGIASVVLAYEAGGVIKVGTGSAVGGFTTQPVDVGGASNIKVSFRSVPWTAATPKPAKVEISYGTEKVTIDISAASDTWPLCDANMLEYSASFASILVATPITITTLNETGLEKRVFIDDFKIEVQTTPPSNLTSTEKNGINLIYPNPAKNIVNIDMQELNDNADVTIVNLEGKVIVKQTIAKGINKIAIDVSSLINGSYILKITSNQLNESQRLIVKK